MCTIYTLFLNIYNKIQLKGGGKNLLSDLKSCRDIRSCNKCLKNHGLDKAYNFSRLRYWNDPRPMYGLWRRKDGGWQLLHNSPSVKELVNQLHFYVTQIYKEKEI